MKTRKLFIPAILAFALIATSCMQGTKEETADTSADDKTSTMISGVTINPEKSTVFWSGTMLGIYTHTGTLNLTNADLTLKDGKITGGSFTADMTTMVATDENYNPEEGSTPERLIGHLSSDDFFAVETYPAATFKITGSEGNTVSGMLSIRGKTHAEKVENVEMMKEGEQVKITGDMTFDRKKYDVSWDSPVQDRVLSGDIKLKIELIGK
jgi:polyisoprenoid-binding protein YceI